MSRNWNRKDLSPRSLSNQKRKEEKIDAIFDTTIVGPWMTKGRGEAGSAAAVRDCIVPLTQWPLVNHNRHTAQLKAEGLKDVTKA